MGSSGTFGRLWQVVWSGGSSTSVCCDEVTQTYVLVQKEEEEKSHYDITHVMYMNN